MGQKISNIPTHYHPLGTEWRAMAKIGYTIMRPRSKSGVTRGAPPGEGLHRNECGGKLDSVAGPPRGA